MGNKPVEVPGKGQVATDTILATRKLCSIIWSKSKYCLKNFKSSQIIFLENQSDPESTRRRQEACKIINDQTFFQHVLR